MLLIVVDVHFVYLYLDGKIAYSISLLESIKITETGSYEEVSSSDNILMSVFSRNCYYFLLDIFVIDKYCIKPFV